jgi:hypothetical protein
MKRAETGVVPKVRYIPAFDALDEAIGRATEMGRPVHWTTGHGGAGLYSDKAGDHMSGLSLLSYIAGKCAERGTKLIATCGFSEMIPIAEDVIYQAALAAGKPEYYQRDMVRFNTDNWHTYALYTMTTVIEENVASNIMVGNLSSTEGMIIGTGAVMIGSMNITGSRSPGRMAQIINISDYFLIGEEMPAAGAIISGDKDSLASVISSDYSKVLYFIVIILGIVMASLGLAVDWFMW